MRVYNKEEARERINWLARAGREFVFIINYAQTQAYIKEVCDIDSDELLVSFPHFSNVPPGLRPFRSNGGPWCPTARPTGGASNS